MRCQGGSIWLALATLVLYLSLACGRCAAASADALPATLTAQAWEFADLGGVGRTVDWQALDKGGVLVFFFDLRSADSLLGLYFFDALFNRAMDFGLKVIGVEATGRPAAEVRSLLQSYAAVYKMPSFPVIADQDFSVAKLFDNQTAPTVLLIGNKGEIIVRHSEFELRTAVEIARRVERLLKRSEGFLSPALREAGLSELRERQLSTRGALPDNEERAGANALAWGDRLPAFEFTDSAGRVDRWDWQQGELIRVAFFWNGSSQGAVADLAFFQGLQKRAGPQGLEIIAVESTGLKTALVAEIMKDFSRRSPGSSIRVVPDPQGRLVRLFGAGEPLPQTFLVDGRGEVLYRADGFDTRVRRVLEEKIDRALRLADPGLQQAGGAAAAGAAPGRNAAEAPSINRRLERDEALRLNLSRGDYFFSNTEYDRAVLFYQRYLELEPSSLHALVRLAQIYDLLREPALAREFWERVLKLRPDHAEARRRAQEWRRSGAP